MQLPRVIVNPIAGWGRGAAAIKEVEAAFAAGQQRLELLVTERPGDATRWAREAAELGVPYVAGVGGDGTANEIVNGLALWVQDGGDPARLPKFGLVPTGTGNDFGYNFQLPAQVDAACQRLFAGQTRRMDVGLVQADTEKPLYFVNGVGLGFDAIVNIESRKIRWVRGAAVFLPAVLKTLLLYYRAPRVVVRYGDMTFEDQLLMVSVMNGERFGAIFHMTPGCHIDDGQLSLCFTSKMSQPRMLAMVPRFVKGSHPGQPTIRRAEATSLTLQADEALPAHVDGEIYTVRASRYEFSIMPWQLDMIC